MSASLLSNHTSMQQSKDEDHDKRPQNRPAVATRPVLKQYVTMDFHVPRKAVTEPPPYQSPGEIQPIVQPWTPKSRKHVPWMTMVALIVVIGCVVGCVAILKTSDGRSIDVWPTVGAPVQPSVMLSVGAALINMSIRFMFNEGVNITWWKNAIRGSTVGELHRTWSFGNNIMGSIAAGRNFNFVALASLFISILAVDGPLLQKASKVKTAAFTETNMVTVNLTSNNSLLNHPTGWTTGRTSTVDLLSDELLPVVQQYNARSPIALNYTGCSGTCNTTIVGPGFDVHCAKSTQPVTISLNAGSSTPVMGFSFVSDGKFTADVITLNNTFRSLDALDALTVHNCTIRLAMVRYPVKLNNHAVTLLPVSTPVTNETIELQFLEQETTGMGRWPTALGGLALIGQRKYGSTGTLYMNGSPYQLVTTGEASIEYLAPNSTDFAWLDPTDDMLNAMRELMFRYAIAISNTTFPQVVTATTASNHTVYSSDFNYLYYAIAFIAAAILTTTINLRGWWELGQSFDLGPFAIAKAFNAPYLDDVSYSRTNEKSFKAIAKRPIQYGELEGDATGAKSLRREYHGAGTTAFEMADYGGEEGARSRPGMGFPSTYR